MKSTEKPRDIFFLLNYYIGIGRSEQPTYNNNLIIFWYSFFGLVLFCSVLYEEVQHGALALIECCVCVALDILTTCENRNMFTMYLKIYLAYMNLKRCSSCTQISTHTQTHMETSFIKEDIWVNIWRMDRWMWTQVSASTLKNEENIVINAIINGIPYKSITIDMIWAHCTKTHDHFYYRLNDKIDSSSNPMKSQLY